MIKRPSRYAPRAALTSAVLRFPPAVPEVPGVQAVRAAPAFPVAADPPAAEVHRGVGSKLNQYANNYLDFNFLACR